jgi:prefoldin subunit 5
MHELQDQIATLEDEIESLSEQAERCRKTIMLAKLGALAGGLVLIALIVGLFASSTVLLISSVTAALGGIALAGSSQSTLDTLDRDIDRREALRTEIINRLELQAIRPG